MSVNVTYLTDTDKRFKELIVHNLADSANKRTEQLKNKVCHAIPKRDAKKRLCLKCGIMFESAGKHNRTCGSCMAENRRVSKRASQTYGIVLHDEKNGRYRQ